MREMMIGMLLINYKSPFFFLYPSLPLFYIARDKRGVCIIPTEDQKGIAVSCKRRSYTWLPQPVKGQQESDDVTTDDFYVSVTLLYSGNWLHLLSEYQLTVSNPWALVMNSQILKGQIFLFVSEYSGSLSNEYCLVEDVSRWWLNRENKPCFFCTKSIHLSDLFWNIGRTEAASSL